MVKTPPSDVMGIGSNPSSEAKISHDSWPKNQSIKQKQCCIKFSKDFKNGPHQKKAMPSATVLLFSHSVVSDSVTPWTAARQAPLSIGFSRQGYWSGLPLPSPSLKITPFFLKCVFNWGVIASQCCAGFCCTTA